MKKRLVTVKRPDLMRIIYFKYMAKEIEFKEMRQRMISVNELFQWIVSARVQGDAYTRLMFRLEPRHILNERFLSLLGQGGLKTDELEAASEEDFPRDLETFFADKPDRNDPTPVTPKMMDEIYEKKPRRTK